MRPFKPPKSNHFLGCENQNLCDQIMIDHVMFGKVTCLIYLKPVQASAVPAVLSHAHPCRCPVHAGIFREIDVCQK